MVRLKKGVGGVSNQPNPFPSEEQVVFAQLRRWAREVIAEERKGTLLVELDFGDLDSRYFEGTLLDTLANRCHRVRPTTGVFRFKLMLQANLDRWHEHLVRELAGEDEPSEAPLSAASGDARALLEERP